MKTIRGFAAAARLLTRPRRSGDGYETPPALRRRIKETFGEDLSAEQLVERIVTDVRERGDVALREYTLRLDKVELDCLEVSEREWKAACNKVNRSVLRALEMAAERIRRFYEMSREHGPSEFSHAGLGQMVQPLERVGLYAPGGTASYPSTVLMTAVPAKVAGVGEIVLTTPPRSDGSIPTATLAAARLAGVARVFKLGGAQAIAALAYGTETVPRVDKICGPGNIFVVLAKKQVFGQVAIDGLHGPSEVVIIADGTAEPALCAAEMVAQAEHDTMASAILVTPSARLAQKVEQAVERQLEKSSRLPSGRRDIIAQSLEENGRIVLVDDVAEAVELAALYAPEHLCLMVRRAEEWALKVRNAGAVFVGKWSPVAMGDYVAGPSHVLPTGGTARFSSPLGVSDFLRVSHVVALDARQFKALGPVARTLAEAEGLEAHGQAVAMRLSNLSLRGGRRRRTPKQSGAPGRIASAPSRGASQ
ncbi:MAG: histidinol dehydrogenase [Dehalococcoidia bacterium]|nr:histidinol dehydrogenase [Dehalococcoidia bacterium]